MCATQSSPPRGQPIGARAMGEDVLKKRPPGFTMSHPNLLAPSHRLKHPNQNNPSTAPATFRRLIIPPPPPPLHHPVFLRNPPPPPQPPPPRGLPRASCSVRSVPCRKHEEYLRFGPSTWAKTRPAPRSACLVRRCARRWRVSPFRRRTPRRSPRCHCEPGRGARAQPLDRGANDQVRQRHPFGGATIPIRNALPLGGGISKIAVFPDANSGTSQQH